MTGFVFGVAVGATLMYLFDPRQGQERRELWSDRVRRGREQAQSAIETSRERVDELRHHGEHAPDETGSAYDSMREQMSSATSDGGSEDQG
jgi:gas vesicle protein